jgi:pilus assembly protein Flp/PilA
MSWEVINLHLKSLQDLHRHESGQGLVEYVLIIALVALTAVAGMTGLATKVNSAFSQVGSVFASHMTRPSAV